MSENANLRNRYPMVFVPSEEDTPHASDDGGPEGIYIVASERHYGILMPIPSIDDVTAMTQTELEEDIVAPLSREFCRAADAYRKRMAKRHLALPLPEVPGPEMKLDYGLIRLEGKMTDQTTDVAGPPDGQVEEFSDWFLFISGVGVAIDEFLSDTHAMRLH